MSNNNNLFRVTSFGGFNKEDVARYIEEQTHKLNQTCETFSLEKKMLTDKVSFFEDILKQHNIADLNKYISETIDFSKKLEENSASIASMQSKINTLTKDNQHLTHENSSITASSNTTNITMDKKVHELEDEISSLNEKLANALKVVNESKNTRDAIIRLELEAHIRAKSITDASKKESEEMIDRATEKANAILENATKSSEQIIEEQNVFAQSTKQELSALIGSSKQSIDFVQSRIQEIFEKNTQIMDKLESLNCNLEISNEVNS